MRSDKGRQGQRQRFLRLKISLRQKQKSSHLGTKVVLHPPFLEGQTVSVFETSRGHYKWNASILGTSKARKLQWHWWWDKSGFLQGEAHTTASGSLLLSQTVGHFPPALWLLNCAPSPSGFTEKKPRYLQFIHRVTRPAGPDDLHQPLKWRFVQSAGNRTCTARHSQGMGLAVQRRSWSLPSVLPLTDHAGSIPCGGCDTHTGGGHWGWYQL